MPGGLLQLIAVGAQDAYLTNSPEMSFFKQVIKRATKFSMESIRQVFLTNPTLSTSSSQIFTCRIGRYGDLLGEVYLCFTLPDIYSDEIKQFRWIKNMANHMLLRYSVSIDTQKIDERYGDWLDVWNELSMTSDKKYGYDKMIGNVEDYILPRIKDPLVLLKNNRLYYTFYPKATADTPSIPSRTFYLPLDFWFSKNPSLALPLIALQFQNIDITIELRNVEELYQIYDIQTAQYLSPVRYRNLYPLDTTTNLQNFLSFTGLQQNTSIDLKAHLECNFYFLDTPERSYIASHNTDYIVEGVYREEFYGLAKGANIIDIVLSNPIKETIFVLRRSDAIEYNEWYNFTARYPMNENYETLDTAKIIWNGVDRIEEKPGSYFNMLQPYQHHTSHPRGGIYCYSYGLYPEKIQSTGTFNASMISKISLALNTKSYPDFDTYDAVVFNTYYNIFRVMAGSGGMVFAS